MFLVSHEGGLRGRFACVPDSCYLHEQRCQKKVVTRQDFIARVSGTRSYPWRILAVADEDRELPVNNLVYALAAENKIGDCSWVRPGKVAWEWWNNWGLITRISSRESIPEPIRPILILQRITGLNMSYWTKDGTIPVREM